MVPGCAQPAQPIDVMQSWCYRSTAEGLQSSAVLGSAGTGGYMGSGGPVLLLRLQQQQQGRHAPLSTPG